MRFKATEIVSLSVATLAFAGSIISAFYTYVNRSRELDIELVKIGISILRADPKETQTEGAREWAIKVIETNSRQPFSPEARQQLLGNRLNLILSTVISTVPLEQEAYRACLERAGTSEELAKCTTL